MNGWFIHIKLCLTHSKCVGISPVHLREGCISKLRPLGLSWVRWAHTL